MILVTGAVGVGVSIYLSATDQVETWTLFLAVIGLFGVPITVIFALGIFTRRASTVGVVAGLAAATVIAGLIQFNGAAPSPSPWSRSLPRW